MFEWALNTSQDSGFKYWESSNPAHDMSDLYGREDLM